MISFAYSPAVYDGTNASLTSAVSANGWPEIGKRYRIPPRCTANLRMALADYIAVMSACPQNKNPINGHDAVPSEFRFSFGA